MKRNYLLFCNHIAFCSIGILAVLIMGAPNTELEPSSEWLTPSFGCSAVSWIAADKSKQGEVSENNCSFSQWKGKKDSESTLNSDQNLEKSLFLDFNNDFLALPGNNIFTKTQYSRLLEYSKDFFSVTSLLEVRSEMYSKAFLQLKSDLLVSEKGYKQLKGFVIVVKIPDKLLS